MSMNVNLPKQRGGISYKKRKKAEKHIKEQFDDNDKKSEDSSWWGDLKDKVLGKSFEDTMKENQKKNKKKLLKKKKK